MRISIEIHHAGKEKTNKAGQKKDCTVRALATGLNMTYLEAFNLLKKLGRKSNQGTWVHRDYLDRSPFATRLTLPTGYNLTQFLQDYPEGTYLVSVPGHITTLIDGVFHDNHFYHWYLTTGIEHAWKIELNTTRLKPVGFRVKTDAR